MELNGDITKGLTLKDGLALLDELGWKKRDQDGRHEVWFGPHGRSLKIARTGKGGSTSLAPRYMRSLIRRAVAERGESNVYSLRNDDTPVVPTPAETPTETPEAKVPVVTFMHGSFFNRIFSWGKTLDATRSWTTAELFKSTGVSVNSCYVFLRQFQDAGLVVRLEKDATEQRGKRRVRVGCFQFTKDFYECDNKTAYELYQLAGRRGAAPIPPSTTTTASTAPVVHAGALAAATAAEALKAAAAAFNQALKHCRTFKQLRIGRIGIESNGERAGMLVIENLRIEL
jgi:hypothetical protein